MAVLVRIVSVRSDREVSRVELGDDGSIVYSGGETARSAVARVMRERDVDEAPAIVLIAAEGWSNGYLMAALDQQ